MESVAVVRVPSSKFKEGEHAKTRGTIKEDREPISAAGQAIVVRRRKNALIRPLGAAVEGAPISTG
jgi:hypothetical protein